MTTRMVQSGQWGRAPTSRGLSGFTTAHTFSAVHSVVKRLLAAALFSPFLVGCGAPELSFWVHTEKLVQPAQSAAERIETATGLVISVNETMPDSAPIFESAHVSAEYGGAQALLDYNRTAKEGVKFIAVDAKSAADAERILLHEFVHALGVTEHVGDPNALLYGRPHGNYLLTVTDLRALCKVRKCTRQIPET